MCICYLRYWIILCYCWNTDWDYYCVLWYCKKCFPTWLLYCENLIPLQHQSAQTRLEQLLWHTQHLLHIWISNSGHKYTTWTWHDTYCRYGTYDTHRYKRHICRKCKIPAVRADLFCPLFKLFLNSSSSSTQPFSFSLQILLLFSHYPISFSSSFLPLLLFLSSKLIPLNCCAARLYVPPNRKPKFRFQLASSSFVGKMMMNVCSSCDERWAPTPTVFKLTHWSWFNLLFFLSFSLKVIRKQREN